MKPPRIHNLASARCRNHPDREAVAFCRECEHYFCRECVVEHDGRMICKTCLTALLDTPGAPPASRKLAHLLHALAALAGGICAWLFFMLLGRAIISLKVLLEVPQW